MWRHTRVILFLDDLTHSCNSFVTDKNIYATLFLFNSFWDFFVSSIIIFSELKL